MSTVQQSEEMVNTANDIRDAIREKRLDRLESCFTDDCEIELFGLKLKGKTGVRKWFNWTFSHMSKLDFENTHLVVDGHVLIEEYVVNGVIHTGSKVQSRQMRSMIFDGSKVKTFRLYMDRLQFADSIANDFATKIIIKKFTQISVKEML